MKITLCFSVHDYEVGSGIIPSALISNKCLTICLSVISHLDRTEGALKMSRYWPECAN